MDDVEAIIKQKLEQQKEWLRARAREIERKPTRQRVKQHGPLERGEMERRRQRRQAVIEHRIFARPLLKGVE